MSGKAESFENKKLERNGNLAHTRINKSAAQRGNDDKLSVVIYGNCHTGIISQMLESCQAFNEFFYIIPTKRIQDIKDPRELYDNSYSQCDVFIHQSIRLNNRYGEEYASENIISRLKPGCRVISIPNVYHLPLCFFPQYSDAQELRTKGVTYFFRDSIIDSHIDKPLKLLRQAKKDYDNPNRFEKGEIVASFESFIDKVRKREMDWDIKVSDFILENYRTHQLFYDPNHPTNYFLSYITAELLKMLTDEKVTFNQLEIDSCLDSIETPMCKAVVDALQLKWRNNLIRNSMPNTNRLQCKTNLSIYIYQYLSCVWIADDYPIFLKTIGHILWKINTMVAFVRRGIRYMVRKINN